MDPATPFSLPDQIQSVDELEELLSRPTPPVVAAMSRLKGDLLILGVGGKMGPTLARMARRALDAAANPRRVIGVARFSQPDLPQQLHVHGVETIRADLLDARQLADLPDAPHVVSMTGMKFGSSDQQSLTWAMNVWLAGMVMQRFRGSQVVAFSTGNVYPLTPVHLGGSRETDPVGPVGEYAASALGRERIYEHFSRVLGTPISLVRLNYAQDLRYGVLVDLARRVHQEQPVNLAMGHFNAIWQGDANAMALASFDQLASPPWVFNVAGPETISVRRVAEEFSRRFAKPAQFTGQESPDALLSNAERAFGAFGYPSVPLGRMLDWISHWVAAGGPSLDKPTHFETRDGKF